MFYRVNDIANMTGEISYVGANLHAPFETSPLLSTVCYLLEMIN